MFHIQLLTQECIPVGCVPSAAVAVSWGGGLLPGGVYSQGGVSSRGVSALRGVCSQGGVCSWGCLLPGVSALGGGGCLLPGGWGCGCLLPGVGLSASRGGWCLLWGVSAPGGGVPACTEADTPPCGQTHTCKNITFATSLRSVIMI